MDSTARIGAFVVVTLAAGLATAGARAAPVPAPSPSPAPSPKPDSKPGVSGYAQIDYRSGDRQGVATAAEHEFNVRRARLGFSGRITDRLAYTVMVQGDGLNANSASLLEAYADVTLSKWLKARAGQYKYDFDVEGRESAHQIPFPDRPFATQSVAGGLSGASSASSPSSSFRDRGLTLAGSTRRGRVRWGGALGLFQGTGRASDNNDAFAWVANAYVEPAAGLKLGGGFLSSDNAPEGSTAKDEYSAWTAGAAYDKGPVFLRVEYYHGRRERGGPSEGLDGFYASASYTPTGRLDLLGRYQELADERFGPGGRRVRSVDLGVKCYLDRRERRSGSFLVVAYEIRDADAGFASGVTVLNDGRGAPLESGDDVGHVLVARLQVRF